MAGLDLTISGRARSLLSPGSDRSDMDISPSKSCDSPMSTPRKNKRKSSSPKRRSDFSIKRFCPDTPRALNLETEDCIGRPGYGEHPPSTPETSASSSTPSPPDAAELRIPQVLRHQGMVSPHQHMTSPRSVTSPETVHRQHPQFMPPYPMGAAYMPVNPLILQHMMALQQQGVLPSMPGALPSMPGALSGALPSVPGTLPSAVHQQLAAVSQLPRASHQTIPPPHAISHTRQQTQRSTHTTTGHAAPATSAPQGASNKSTSKTVTAPNPQTPSTSSDINLSNSRISNDSMSLSTSRISDPSFQSDNDDEEDYEGGKRRKNYKNMTRERRIEANARERSRVHTISAAFETLRHSVPSFSHNQRLSKLAILRIACSYIMSLASLAGHDYSWGRNQMSFEDSVDQCTKTIQNEGRAKRRH